MKKLKKRKKQFELDLRRKKNQFQTNPIFECVNEPAGIASFEKNSVIYVIGNQLVVCGVCSHCRNEYCAQRNVKTFDYCQSICWCVTDRDGKTTHRAHGNE